MGIYFNNLLILQGKSEKIYRFYLKGVLRCKKSGRGELYFFTQQFHVPSEFESKEIIEKAKPDIERCCDLIKDEKSFYLPII